MNADNSLVMSKCERNVKFWECWVTHKNPPSMPSYQHLQHRLLILLLPINKLSTVTRTYTKSNYNPEVSRWNLQGFVEDTYYVFCKMAEEHSPFSHITLRVFYQNIRKRTTSTQKILYTLHSQTWTLCVGLRYLRVKWSTVRHNDLTLKLKYIFGKIILHLGNHGKN